MSIFYFIYITEIALEAGRHVYHFVCQIPAVCPSSFEGAYGRVRYMVYVKLIRPWKFDQTFSRPFTVLKVMDLNREGLFLRVSSSFLLNTIYMNQSICSHVVPI